MGRVLRALYKRKYKKRRAALDDMLARYDDVSFLQLAWAVNTLHVNRHRMLTPYWLPKLTPCL